MFQIEIGDKWLSRNSMQTIGLATSARGAYKILSEYARKENYALNKEVKHNIIGLIELQGDLIDKNDGVENYDAKFNIGIVSTNELLV